MIPSIGRPSLVATLSSLVTQEWSWADRVVVVFDGPSDAGQQIARSFLHRLPLTIITVDKTDPSDWGHTPRNKVMPTLSTRFLAALDDDDVWTSDALAGIREAVTEHPDRPHMFRMDATNWDAVGKMLWEDRVLRQGNVGTPMFVVPNIPGRLGRFTNRYGGDFDFIESTAANFPPVIWHERTICLVRPRPYNQ